MGDTEAEGDADMTPKAWALLGVLVALLVFVS